MGSGKGKKAKATRKKVKSLVANAIEKLDVGGQPPPEPPVVAQVFHPYAEAGGFDAKSLAKMFRKLDERLADTVRLVVSGAGLLSCQVDSEDALSEEEWSDPAKRLSRVQEIATQWLRSESALANLVAYLGRTSRDWVLGLDVWFPNDQHGWWRCGQFAAIVGATTKPPLLVPKVYPTPDEANWLPGYPFDNKGLEATNKIVTTAAGKVLVLVCHDVTALTKRAQTNVKTGYRKRVVRFLHKQLRSGKPDWIVNLIHHLAWKRDQDEPTQCKGFASKHTEIWRKSPRSANGLVGAAGLSYERSRRPTRLIRYAKICSEKLVHTKEHEVESYLLLPE